MTSTPSVHAAVLVAFHWKLMYVLAGHCIAVVDAVCTVLDANKKFADEVAMT